MLDFLNSNFLTGCGRLKTSFCIIISNLVKIGKTVVEISRFLLFFKIAAMAILDFINL